MPNTYTRNPVQETIRLMPRGAKNKLLQHQPLTTADEAMLTWYNNHHMTTQKPNGTWTFTPHGRKVRDHILKILG